MTSHSAAQEAPAAAKKAVRNLSEVPRFSYPVTGDLNRFLDRPELLAGRTPKDGLYYLAKGAGKLTACPASN